MGSVVKPPFLVALNLTRRCNLGCAHCYLDAGTRLDGDARELTTDEVRDILAHTRNVFRGEGDNIQIRKA
jgi:MoaA/NifB/PqqE/SkfB family radical SAM enzyme